MQKINSSSLLRITGATLLVAGTFLLLLGTRQTLHALEAQQQIGQGSMVLQQIGGEAALLPDPYHGAAPQGLREESGAGLIVLGLILFLLGFGMHALLVIRKEHPVPVKRAPRRKVARKTAPQNIEVLEVFWMEILP